MQRPVTAAVFFEANAEALIDAGSRGGGEGVVGFIQQFQSVAERLILYTLSRQLFVMGDRPERDLDLAIAVADAAIDEVEEAVASGAASADLVRSLHILNFNLAADLADCWPDDGLRRERRHFERGLIAAEALLDRVFEGTLDARIIANDHWVAGMHRLSLGDAADALLTWQKASRHAGEAAATQGLPPGPAATSTFQCNLIAGYVAIARWLTAGEAAKVQAAGLYGAAIAAFQSQAAQPAAAGEAAFGVSQLETVRQRYAPALPIPPAF